MRLRQSPKRKEFSRTISIADAHPDHGKRYVVHADEKLTAFLEVMEKDLTKSPAGLPTGHAFSDFSLHVVRVQFVPHSRDPTHVIIGLELDSQAR